MYGLPTFFDMSVWAWITYGVQGLAAVVCVGVVLRALIVPSDVRRQCCCGGCGHAIVDVKSERCPECGGLLTKVGVSTPAMAVRLRGGMGWAVLAWTVVCGLGVQVAGEYLQYAAWQSTAGFGGGGGSGATAHGYEYDLGPNTFSSGFGRDGQDLSSLKWRIDLKLDYVEDGGVIDSGTAELTLRKTGTLERAIVTLDLSERSLELSDKDGTVLLSLSADKISEATVANWFDAAGLGTTGAGMDRAVKDTLLLMRACFDDPEGATSLFDGFSGFGGEEELGSLQSRGGGGGTTFVGGGSGGGPGAPDYWTTRTIVVAAVLGAVYVAGVVVIWWRRRRILA
jgi:hypothetical protein